AAAPTPNWHLLLPRDHCHGRPVGAPADGRQHGGGTGGSPPFGDGGYGLPPATAGLSAPSGAVVAGRLGRPPLAVGRAGRGRVDGNVGVSGSPTGGDRPTDPRRPTVVEGAPPAAPAQGVGRTTPAPPPPPPPPPPPLPPSVPARPARPAGAAAASGGGRALRHGAPVPSPPRGSRARAFTRRLPRRPTRHRRPWWGAIGPPTAAAPLALATRAPAWRMAGVEARPTLPPLPVTLRMGARGGKTVLAPRWPPAPQRRHAPAPRGSGGGHASAAPPADRAGAPGGRSPSRPPHRGAPCVRTGAAAVARRRRHAHAVEALAAAAAHATPVGVAAPTAAVAPHAVAVGSATVTAFVAAVAAAAAAIAAAWPPPADTAAASNVAAAATAAPAPPGVPGACRPPPRAPVAATALRWGRRTARRSPPPPPPLAAVRPHDVGPQSPSAPPWAAAATASTAARQ
ncbi:hypothetical protein BU14_0869s0002, partial [Porphyra umbilicalis]